jgi:hypothetical protein
MNIQARRHQIYQADGTDVLVPYIKPRDTLLTLMLKLDRTGGRYMECGNMLTPILGQQIIG